MKKTKTYRGKIKNWQTHTLSVSNKVQRQLEQRGCLQLIVTGTVIEDPTGRFRPGWHMKSSLVVKLDRKNGRLETINSYYDLIGAEGGDVVPDLGNGVLNLFY